MTAAIMFCSIVLTPFAPDARAECSRKTLQKLTDTYVKAVTAGKATLLPLAAKSSYTVNDKPIGVSEGVLADRSRSTLPAASTTPRNAPLSWSSRDPLIRTRT